jgi:hypothetical protein
MHRRERLSLKRFTLVGIFLVVSLGFSSFAGMTRLGSDFALVRPVLASPAAGAYFSVEPSDITFGPSPAVGETFSVVVWLHNLTIATAPDGLSGVEIQVSWNITILQPLSFVNRVGTAGGALNSPILYGFSPGYYNEDDQLLPGPDYSTAVLYKVAAASTGSPWFGDGAVAELTFNATYQPMEPQPAATSPIHFAFTDIVDTNINPVDHETFDGQYTMLPLININPDMLISAMPPTRSIIKGQTTDYTVNVTSMNALSSLVTFEAVTAPASGMTFEFSPETVDLQPNLSSQSTLTVSGTAAEMAGIYDVTITATAGSIIRSTQVQLTLEAPPMSNETRVVFLRDPLNLNSINPNQNVSVLLELAVGLDVNDVNVSTVVLNGTIPAIVGSEKIGDFDANLIPDIVFEFDYVQTVDLVLSQNITLGSVMFTLTGSLYNGTEFGGSDTVQVSALFADLDCNGVVGLSDLVAVAKAYRSHPDDPNWNANADLAEPFGVISLTDVLTIAAYYNTSIS